MLALRQIIPPLTIRTGDGSFLHAWDYKQKNSLVIVFLHLECPSCAMFLAQLSAQAGEIAVLNAVALVVFLAALPPGASAPNPVILASEVSGRAAREYFGGDPFGSKGLSKVGVFVADRYGELRGQWQTRESDELPEMSDIMRLLRQFDLECG